MTEIEWKKKCKRNKSVYFSFMSAVLIYAAEDVASHLCPSGSPHGLLAPPSGLFYILIQIYHKGLEIINLILK